MLWLVAAVHFQSVVSREKDSCAQVSIRTGMDALVASTAALGSRLLTDSVVGPPRVQRRQRRRQPALEKANAGTWQPGWPSEGRPLAARIFAA